MEVQIGGQNTNVFVGLMYLLTGRAMLIYIKQSKRGSKMPQKAGCAGSNKGSNCCN